MDGEFSANNLHKSLGLGPSGTQATFGDAFGR